MPGILPRLAAATLVVLLAGQAQAADGWVSGNNSRIRLIAAPVKGTGGATKLMAGVEIEMQPGWKTYWRSPGEAGGVPPEFDWKKSTNLSAATVLFPAPSRFVDPTGDSIGYKHLVLFPVTIVAADASKPMTLSVMVNYGVCAKICIPEEHLLTLTVDPADDSNADRIGRALAAVPVPAASAGKDAPRFVELKRDGVNLVIDAQFPAGTGDAQVFAEALDSSYVPMANRLAEAGDGHSRFRIDLSKSDDFKSPAGKMLRLTLAGDDAASEITTAIP